MIWSIIFIVILVALSLKIHGLTLNYLSQNTAKKFIYKDFGINFKATPLLQYRLKVGLGPSLKT